MNKSPFPKETQQEITARHLLKSYRQVCDKLTLLTDMAIAQSAWDTATEFFRMSDACRIFYRNGERLGLVDIYNKLHAFHKHLNERKGTPA